MTAPIALVAGLGNPGQEYEKTRHNVGAWFVEALASQYHVRLRLEPKFKGQVAKVQVENSTCHLLLPTTFMNQSGLALQAVTQFYRIPAEAILVVHDDLDLPPGTIRLKQGGGDGGHNGLRSVVAHLRSKDFVRLRIGIGHPGHRDRVLDYVLGKPRQEEEIEIRAGLDRVLGLFSEIVQGDFQRAMQKLHS